MAYEKSLIDKDWNSKEQDHAEYITFSADDIFEIVKKQFEFIIHDPFLNMTRKFLTIEQFRNPQFASMQNKRVYEDIMNFHKGLIQYLIDNDVFINDDVETMALEFFAPVTIQSLAE